MSLDADVYNERDGDIVATAAFEFGDMAGLGGTSLELCQTDELRINGEIAREWENPITNRLSYHVTFDEPQDEYEFVFSREGEDDVIATVSQPPAFDIVSPGEQETLSRADGLTVEWDPAGDDLIEIFLFPESTDGDSCMESQSETVDDVGAYTFLATEIAKPDGSTVDQCRVDVQLQRTQDGDYPDEFDNGSIRARQNRWVEFISNP
jgi:hypothetical protein